MVDGVRGLAGLLVQLLVGAVSVTEQGLVTAHHQLMEAANARPTVQVTLTQKPATTTHAPVRNSPLISQKYIDLVIYHEYVLL